MTAVTLTDVGVICAHCKSQVSLSSGICFACGELIEERVPAFAGE